MLYYLYRIAIFLSLALPLRWGYRMASFVASCYYAFAKKDRAAVMSNLGVLLPGLDKVKLERICKEVFINFAKYLVDFFRFTKIDRDYVDKHVIVEGFDNISKALSHGKGAIMITAHLGNWELGGAVISVLGHPFTAVALDHRDEKITQFFIRQRQSRGVDVIQIGANLRKCFSVLSANKLLALVGDRDYYDHGLSLDFLTKKTIIPKGPAVFHRRFGSPLIPVFTIRNPDDTFTLKIYEPIICATSSDEHKDIIETTKKILAVLEPEIKKYPGQWFVFREFWKKIGWKKNN